jgi:hypothetical protein
MYQSIHTGQTIDNGISLLKTTENLKTGLRLLGQNELNHGDIGTSAIDLTYSNILGNYGATGEFSFSTGFQTTASGDYSNAKGYNTTASGYYTTAEGYSTIASDESSHAEGTTTVANGIGAHAEGGFTTAINDYSHVEGYVSNALGFASHAEGYSTTAQNEASHAEGRFNIGTATDTIHETGIGTNNSNRLNAFEIYTDGRLTAPELTTALINTSRSLVTKEYVDSFSSTSELEKITEINTGWGLLGDDRTGKGNIGSHAVDFSFSETTGAGLGSSGNYSFVEGYNTTASGDNSHAEGQGTIAQNDNMHSSGVYNIGTATDTIHETGIGVDSSNRKNALEIYTDGTLTAPECTNALIDARGDKSLITKEYADDIDGGSY